VLSNLSYLGEAKKTIRTCHCARTFPPVTTTATCAAVMLVAEGSRSPALLVRMTCVLECPPRLGVSHHAAVARPAGQRPHGHAAGSVGTAWHFGGGRVLNVHAGIPSALEAVISKRAANGLIQIFCSRPCLCSPTPPPPMPCQWSATFHRGRRCAGLARRVKVA
jgi:hypothetical protein